VIDEFSYGIVNFPCLLESGHLVMIAMVGIMVRVSDEKRSPPIGERIGGLLHQGNVLSQRPFWVGFSY